MLVNIHRISFEEAKYSSVHRYVVVQRKHDCKVVLKTSIHCMHHHHRRHHHFCLCAVAHFAANKNLFASISISAQTALTCSKLEFYKIRK